MVVVSDQYTLYLTCYTQFTWLLLLQARFVLLPGKASVPVCCCFHRPNQCRVHCFPAHPLYLSCNQILNSCCECSTQLQSPWSPSSRCYGLLKERQGSEIRGTRTALFLTCLSQISSNLHTAAQLTQLSQTLPALSRSCSKQKALHNVVCT